MPDNEIKREKTFSEELPYFKERIKEVFDYYHNLNGGEDPLYIAVLRDSNRIVRKAEEEITRQQTEIEQWKEEATKYQNLWCMAIDNIEKAKSESVKEFAERLKGMATQRFWETDAYVGVEQIDSLVNSFVKEMVGNIE